MFTTYQLVLPHRHRRSALFSHYVGWSIRWSVRPLVPLYFFGVFKQFEGRKDRPTNGLTDTVTLILFSKKLLARNLRRLALFL